MLFTKECDYAIRIMRALSSGELISVLTGLRDGASALCHDLQDYQKAGKVRIFKKLSGYQRGICAQLKACRDFSL